MTNFLRQATEDNEINLVEGEYIEQIEEVDEGWWTGIGPGGKSGLFPCTSLLDLSVLPPPTIFTIQPIMWNLFLSRENKRTLYLRPLRPLLLHQWV